MRISRLSLGALSAALAVGVAGTAYAKNRRNPGPVSSDSAYVLPTLKGVETVALLTTGDSVNAKPDGTPYRMVGIPDGLGAFDNEDGTFTVLMNHELGATSGIVRTHGAKGAFVSKWIVDKHSLEVLHGEDLIERVFVSNGTTWSTQTIAFARLCSADLPPMSAFYDADTGRGFHGRLFMDGEENGAAGIAYAHGMDGNSYQLPWLGRFSWENCVANGSTGDRTVVAGTDDSTEGQIYVYVGQKSSIGGTPVEKAGLVGGDLFAIKVTGYPFEPAAGIPSGTPFTLTGFGNVFAKTGAQLQTDSRAQGATEFNRPEDACWDPKNPDDLYFVTTASFTGASRLWRLRFVDAAHPELGGTIDMLLDGSEGQHMFDNITVDRRGFVLLQEDVGNNAHIGKVWRYDIKRDELVEAAAHDPARFLAGGSGFLTQDEESSGIVDVGDILGKGWYLLDVQAHYNRGDAELVEGGQLLAMKVPARQNTRGEDEDDDD
jgi:hypothetical protein